MATLIPSLNSCLGRMQAGEKRFARRLDSHLEDDYLCWYEMPVGRRQRYSDFIVLHPARGLLLLEVKDWKMETIHSLDRSSVTLLTPNGLKTASNPLEQVRQCAYQLVNRLESDPQLVNPSGRYQGKLCFPYGYGVVLTQISREQFNSSGMVDVMPEHQVICRDEMMESTDPEEFQKRLWDMFNVSFARQMSLPQIDRVRWHIFPEIRIGDGQAGLFDETPDDGAGGEEGKSADELIPDLIKVMDMQQEQLARSLGQGHRVIHGVAGSGKTLILGYRCLYLARLLHKPILVICFNITLAARLRGMMEAQGINNRVHVYHFHDWCGEQLKRYHVQRPAPGDRYLEELVARVIEATDKGQIPRGQYGALMIDEGHDFEADWLRLVVQMVDPDEGSLLLLYDDAQSIYKKNRALDFSLSSVGIQARGRTTILKLNYRNTNEILDFAYRFAKHYLNPTDSDEDHVPLVEPQAAGRHGPPPYLKLCSSLDEEIRYIAHTLSRLNREGVLWRDMAVTCHSRNLARQLTKGLGASGIPVDRLVESVEKKAFDPARDTVKVMTMHSSKGLEFPVVVIPGVGSLPGQYDDPASDAKLLYVAMTRSTDKLLLTASQESEFVKQLIGNQSR
ncbi:3'-5' exonuclease [Thioalkalivibrio sulfidiphilus]|uniref:3'-5' exonuclease n=1 Tax=Thioalkalivibrio sulfidiphilus TaxID=1033854 RepID=UPI003B39BC95